MRGHVLRSRWSGPTVTKLTGFVLAGGASRRMGAPKHALIFDGETLLWRALGLLRRVATPVVVLGPPDRLLDSLGTSDVRLLPDALPGHGPLGAIYTGLLHTHTELNLFLSCDLPFMKRRFLLYLAAAARTTQADVILARTPHQGLQPLAAIYRRRIFAAVRRSLTRGENKITKFFRAVQVHVIEWPELTRAGFRLSIFDNLNTQEDYARAARRLHQASPH